MLFTAPAFVFLFLPLATIFCALFGKNRKKLCLVCVCGVFHIMFNLHSLWNLVWLPLLVLYAYFAARIAVGVKRRVLGVAMGALPVVWLILVRQLAYFSDFGYVYPTGITLPALCAAAYIWDVTYGDTAEEDFRELWLYITFFPIMLVGPFVDYQSFKKLTEDDAIDMSLPRFSDGIRLFIIGFIKRIAVGAVLIDGYDKIFAYSWDSPNLAIILLLLMLIYFGVFFSLSGYYDMAVGISRMFGINVPEVDAHPFKTATVNEYSKALFGSVRTWTAKYIVRPLGEATGRQGSTLFKITVFCVCTVVFVRTELSALLVCIPLIAFSMASATLKLDKAHKDGRAGLRTVFGMLTVLVIGVFWMFMTISGSNPSVLDYIADISFDNAEYQTDMVLISFSGRKYLFVSLIGAVTLIPRTKWVESIRARLSGRAAAAVDYLGLAALLAMFVCCAIFFLPQFEMYNYSPFRYIII